MLGGNPKEQHLHYGEAYEVWKFLMAMKGAEVAYRMYSSHAGDKDLQKFLRDITENLLRPAISDTEKTLKAENIEFPPYPPERPEVEGESIPAGVRLKDNEIALAVSAEIAAGLIACSMIIGMSIREDIGMMFNKLHMKKVQYGGMMLKMMKDKGWLVVPPLHGVKAR